MSKTKYILTALFTMGLLTLVIGPFLGAGVVSWSVMPSQSWSGLFGWFGWFGGLWPIFPKLPWPF
ncbi:MAG: hypothetical protein ACUVXA_12585 [Candidatus Jordarchaeum sp.]|uniref:hypothetical protein n=1 Tax=Candidatus Jordarchaeum sp. TaxID=2823881 RepID=UPI00404B33C4